MPLLRMSRLSRSTLSLGALAVTCSLCWTGAASAQSAQHGPADPMPNKGATQPEQSDRTGSPLSPLSPGSSSLAPTGRPAKRNPEDYARFDKLREPMLTTQFPGIIDTIVGNRGGVRDALADHGIGVEMQSASSVWQPACSRQQFLSVPEHAGPSCTASQLRTHESVGHGQHEVES